MRERTQEEYNLRYYREMLDVIKQFDGYDALAHIDLIARYDPCGAYPFEKIRTILSEIFQVIISKGKGIEINTSSWHYQLSDTTPGREILRLYYESGGRIITIGSDAHTPQYIGDHESDARQILREIGFTEIYTFDRHTPMPHTI